MNDFSGQTAFITGGGAGIGEAYAKALAKRGATVALADLDLAVAEKAAASIEADGGKAIAVQCDVSDEDLVETAVKKTVDQTGGIDILINNAARHLMTYAGPPTELSTQLWREMLDINVVGIIICSRICRPYLAKRPGVILNMSSIAGFNLSSPYSISKLAVRGLTVTLAKEFATDGIRSCAIAPGFVDSPAAVSALPEDLKDHLINEVQLIHRLGRMDDLVNAMLFLCSDQASFVTGETLIVGGGSATHL